mmetsp:Transcript_64292/g.155434  ORF Transcript_64292/g.155434 Transcript_64292/m.155434 type:complete len:287 (-) Transcript_64292:682-1542(-)
MQWQFRATPQLQKGGGGDNVTVPLPRRWIWPSSPSGTGAAQGGCAGNWESCSGVEFGEGSGEGEGGCHWAQRPASKSGHWGLQAPPSPHAASCAWACASAAASCCCSCCACSLWSLRSMNVRYPGLPLPHWNPTTRSERPRDALNSALIAARIDALAFRKAWVFSVVGKDSISYVASTAVRRGALPGWSRRRYCTATASASCPVKFRPAATPAATAASEAVVFARKALKSLRVRVRLPAAERQSDPPGPSGQIQTPAQFMVGWSMPKYDHCMQASSRFSPQAMLWW